MGRICFKVRMLCQRAEKESLSKRRPRKFHGIDHAISPVHSRLKSENKAPGLELSAHLSRVRHGYVANSARCQNDGVALLAPEIAAAASIVEILGQDRR